MREHLIKPFSKPHLPEMNDERVIRFLESSAIAIAVMSVGILIGQEIENLHSIAPHYIGLLGIAAGAISAFISNKIIYNLQHRQRQK